MSIGIVTQSYTLLSFPSTQPCMSLFLLLPLFVSDFPFDVWPKQKQSGILITATYWSGIAARPFVAVACGQSYFCRVVPSGKDKQGKYINESHTV